MYCTVTLVLWLVGTHLVVSFAVWSWILYRHVWLSSVAFLIVLSCTSLCDFSLHLIILPLCALNCFWVWSFLNEVLQIWPVSTTLLCMLYASINKQVLKQPVQILLVLLDWNSLTTWWLFSENSFHRKLMGLHYWNVVMLVMFVRSYLIFRFLDLILGIFPNWTPSTFIISGTL